MAGQNAQTLSILERVSTELRRFVLKHFLFGARWEVRALGLQLDGRSSMFRPRKILQIFDREMLTPEE